MRKLLLLSLFIILFSVSNAIATLIYSEDFETGSGTYPCTFLSYYQQAPNFAYSNTGCKEGSQCLSMTAYTDGQCGLPVNLTFSQNNYKITYWNKITVDNQNYRGLAQYDVSSNLLGDGAHSGHYGWLGGMVSRSSTKNFMWQWGLYGSMALNVTPELPPPLGTGWNYYEFFINQSCVSMYVYATDGVTLLDSEECVFAPPIETDGQNIALYVSQQSTPDTYFDDVKVYEYDRAFTPTIYEFKFDKDFNEENNQITCSGVNTPTISGVGCISGNCTHLASTSSQYITCSQPLVDYTQPFTIRCGYSLDSFDWKGLVSEFDIAQQGGFMLGVGTVGLYLYKNYGGGAGFQNYYPDAVPNLGQRYMFHYVYDPNEGSNNFNRMFLDGVELVNETYVGSGADSQITPSVPDQHQFGNIINQYYNGMIDECKIWDYALTPQEVALDYSEIAPTCVEDWIPYNTTCRTGHNTLYYLDANVCGTYGDLPLNNGTEQTCPTEKHEFTFDNWSLNDSIGSVTGTKVNAVTDETNCLKGECFTFNNYVGMGNGNVQYINLDAPLVDVTPTTNTNFTVRCGIKTESLYPSSMAIFFANSGTWDVGGESGFNLGLSDGKLYFNDYGIRGFLSTETIQANKWYVVTATYSPSSHKMYLNGVPVTMNGAEGNIALYPLQDNINFGKYSIFFGGEYTWDGSIDECKVWDVKLSDQEVMDDFLTLPPVCQEDWVGDYTACSNEERTLVYTDQNACGTFVDLPLDNGTVQFCGLSSIQTNLMDDGLHYYNPQHIVYNGVVNNTGNNIFNCTISVDGVPDQVDLNIDITQNQTYDKDWGEFEDYEQHSIGIVCENAESSENVSYNYIIDTIQPRIIPTEMNASVYTKVLDPNPDYQIYFENMNLQEIQVTLTDSGMNVLFDDHQYPVGSTNETVIVPIDLNSMDAGEYSVYMFAKDFALERTKIYTFTVEDCPENWMPTYSTCSISDEQVLTYDDLNACGTTSDLPPDNGTISSCNYCTGIYQETVNNCLKRYDWVNYETCCAVTGLYDDCEIPTNITECVGMHTSDDISGVTIDALVEVGAEGIKYVPLIGLGTLATYILFII